MEDRFERDAGCFSDGELTWEDDGKDGLHRAICFAFCTWLEEMEEEGEEVFEAIRRPNACNCLRKLSLGFACCLTYIRIH
jgi:hypothetical protein